MLPLERPLRPNTIAVIGGGSWCENVIDGCRNFGFGGDLYAVHPKREEVAGCPAVRSVSDLPSAPDVAFIGVNRTLTVEIVRALSQMGAGGAVCFASGFLEATEELNDGADLQSALVIAADGMPILGPNCYGFINALDKTALWPDQHGLVPVGKGVAIIAQSSNIALNLTMQARGLPIAYLMTVGNQAQIGLSEIGDALLDDPRVTALGLHIEGIDDLASFEAFAMKAQACGKPVVAVKVGRSEEARAATITHTASLSGSAAGASALLARFGIAEVRSLPVMLEALKLVHVCGGLPDASIASMSCSGGEASLIADVAADHGVTFPKLNKTQAEGLRDALGPKVALANPLDYHTYIWGDIEAMGRTFSAMMMGEASLGLVVLDFPRPDRCTAGEWLKVIDAVEMARNTSGKPIGVLASLPETMPERVADDLVRRGIVPFIGMDDAMSAIKAAAFLGQPCLSAPIHLPKAAANPKILSEDEAKEALSHFGVKVPRNALAEGPENAAVVASNIGFPVVLKGRGIAHKTEAGAVALNLNTAGEVRAAAAEMPATGFLIEEMVTGTRAELLIGIVRDPAHGLVLTVAAGGVLTELLQDSVSLTVPASDADIRGALGQLKLAKVINGFRGNPACDLDAIIRTVMAVQAYATSRPVEEVEINPLMCGANFAIAADALIKCGDSSDG